MAWRSNHQAVYPDPSIPFSSPGCPSLSCSASTGSPYPTSTRTFYHPAPAISIPQPLSKKIQVRSAKNDGAKNDGAKNDGAKNDGAKNNGAKNDGVKNDDVKNDGAKNEGAKNDEVKGWLDDMKAQSPPRFEAVTGAILDAEAQEAAASAQYAAWMKDHPSALETFEDLMVKAAGRQIAVFLDYDGTLSPIVEDPDRAYMSDLMRATVKEVATHFPTAIISGRGREKVYDFVQLAELYYAGSHGMDIMGPAEDCNGFKAVGTRSKDKKGNEVVHFQPASKFLPMMDQVCKTLEEKALKVPGAKVEHNKYCVTLHFRRVKEKSWPELAEHVESILKNFPELQLTLGRKVLEIRPAIAWDKGKAVGFLLKALGLENSKDVLPVYLGDDRTDEDAFVVMNEKRAGCSILVSSVAKRTNALYSLRDPSEVMEFLQTLVRYRIKHPLKRGSPGSVGG